ncbi:hypothetical protein [Chitinophaga polysaccharea]|uniref:hypothetical protein n=1 Tax=Chitinophaga polysaccharea TaxID=1293035 RepID=UPI001158CCA2|nr:hypothetical protein [Chitinophaga polysaccharea]
MEYTLEKQGMKNSLRNDFGQWNMLEDMFKQQLSQKDLESRRFRNMKLKEYNRLIRVYSGAPLTRDEQALMIVMKFQRGSLVRSLYPGLLTRMVYLVSKGLDNLFFHNKELERVKLANDERIINTRIKLPEQPLEQSESFNISKEAAPDNAAGQHQKVYGPDLGQRSVNNDQQKFKGPSI